MRPLRHVVPAIPRPQIRVRHRIGVRLVVPRARRWLTDPLCLLLLAEAGVQDVSRRRLRPRARDAMPPILQVSIGTEDVCALVRGRG